MLKTPWSVILLLGLHWLFVFCLLWSYKFWCIQTTKVEFYFFFTFQAKRKIIFRKNTETAANIGNKKCLKKNESIFDSIETPLDWNVSTILIISHPVFAMESISSEFFCKVFQIHFSSIKAANFPNKNENKWSGLVCMMEIYLIVEQKK